MVSPPPTSQACARTSLVRAESTKYEHTSTCRTCAKRRSAAFLMFRVLKPPEGNQSPWAFVHVLHYDKASRKRGVYLSDVMIVHTHAYSLRYGGFSASESDGSTSLTLACLSQSLAQETVFTYVHSPTISSDILLAFTRLGSFVPRDRGCN